VRGVLPHLPPTWPVLLQHACFLLCRRGRRTSCCLRNDGTCSALRRTSLPGVPCTVARCMPAQLAPLLCAANLLISCASGAYLPFLGRRLNLPTNLLAAYTSVGQRRRGATSPPRSALGMLRWCRWPVPAPSGRRAAPGTKPGWVATGAWAANVPSFLRNALELHPSRFSFMLPGARREDGRCTTSLRDLRWRYRERRPPPSLSPATLCPFCHLCLPFSVAAYPVRTTTLFSLLYAHMPIPHNLPAHPTTLYPFRAACKPAWRR